MLTMSTLMMPAPTAMTMSAPTGLQVPKIETGTKIALNNHNNVPTNKAGKAYSLNNIVAHSFAA